MTKIDTIFRYAEDYYIIGNLTKSESSMSIDKILTLKLTLNARIPTIDVQH